MTLTPATTPLSAAEARVLATLMEKARTVPDSYPLTLNTLLLGCNQKSSREPLMDLSEADIAAAIDSLKNAGLVRESSGGRTARFEHNAQRGIGVPEQSAVLLGLLMLRGPQTAAELRLNSERWYRFADVSSVEGFLEEMQDRSDDKGGPRVASRGNVTPLIDVVFPVFISHSEPQSNCLRRAFRNERVARLEASPARSPMMRRCSLMGHKTCRFEQPAQDHLLGALGTPLLDSTL